MVSEQDYPRQQMVWSDWCGWYVPRKPPKFLPALVADRPYSSSASARRPWPFRSIVSSSSSLSGCGGGPYRQEMGVIGLGSSACKIPSRFQSESALEPYLPRQIPDSSDLRRRRGPAEIALAVSGPDRREVKVPHSTPGKIPNPSSDLGKMKEWVVSYEEDASDPTAIWRVISATNYKADVGQHQLGKLEMARRVDDMRLINVRSTPEGNYNNLSTGFSVVVSGWGQDPLPCSLASSTGNHQNLSQEPASDRQWLQNPKENLSQPHSQYQAKQWDSNPSNKMVLSVSTDDDDLLSSNNMKIEQMEQTKVKANLCSVDYQLRKDPGKEIHEQEVYGIYSYKHNCLKEIMPADLDGSIDDKHAFIEVMIPELPEQERRGLPPQSGLLWNLPPWPDLSFCEVYWMAMSMEKGAGAVSRRNAYNVVAGQSKNQFQPMKNKVKGAVEFCDVRLSQVRNLLGKITYDPKSCTWMSGVNVINLDKGRKHNVTDNDLLLLEKFKTKDGVTVAKSLEVEDKVKLVSIVKDKESVYALAMNDTGPLLVSGGTESVVRVWDPGSESKNIKWGRIETSGHMLSFNVVTEDNVEVVSSQAEAERQWMQISVKSPSVGKNIKLNVKKSNSAADVKCCYTVAKFLRPGVIVKHYKESAESSIFWFSFGGKQSYTNKNATQDISVREPHLYAFSVRNRGLEELKLQLKVFFSCVVLRLFRSRYGTSYQQHEVALEALVDFCRQKKFMVEIYSKMDCDLQCSNVFENLANLLSKSAFPVNSPLFSLNVLALNKLVIQAIAERINNAPKHYVQTETVLNQALGENFFDPTTKKWTTKNTASATCKRGFIQSYYEPIKQIIKTCMNDQKDKLWPLLQKLGMNLENFEPQMLGSCKRVTVSKDDTVILDRAGNKKSIEERAEQIRSAIERNTSDYDKERLQERLAKLFGDVAILKIGGASEAEMMGEVGSKHMSYLPDMIPCLLGLLNDETPAVARPAVKSGTNLFATVLEQLVIQGLFSSDGIEDSLNISWEWLLKLKSVVSLMAFQHSINEGVRLLAVKFVEKTVIMYTLDPNIPSDPPSKATEDMRFNVAWLQGGHPLLNVGDLAMGASQSLGLWLEQLKSLKVKSLSTSMIIVLVSSLSAIDQGRHSFYGRILPVLLSLNPASSIIKMQVPGAFQALKSAFTACLKCTHSGTEPWRVRLWEAQNIINQGDSVEHIVSAARSFRYTSNRAESLLLTEASIDNSNKCSLTEDRNKMLEDGGHSSKGVRQSHDAQEYSEEAKREMLSQLLLMSHLARPPLQDLGILKLLTSASVDDAAVIEDLLTKRETRSLLHSDRLVTQLSWGPEEQT